MILKASSVDELVEDAPEGASTKNYDEISEFFKKIGTNRRLLDKNVEMDLKMPWNILSFSDDTLKKTYHDSVRSTRRNFCEKRALPVWWLRTLLARTFFYNNSCE
ncbi:MAG: hypothetical protein GY853_15460 [PVC group bacterium]|nr:hypothetical protein [PVC group bacterium]